MVVGHRLAVEDDLLGIGLDLGHLAEQHLHVALGAHQLPQGCGHISAGHQAGGHLIEQGLEEVEVALVDQGDAHIGALEGLAGFDAGKAAADNHHVGLVP